MIPAARQPIAVFIKITCPHCGIAWLIVSHPDMGSLYYEGSFSETAYGYLVASPVLICPSEHCLYSLDGVSFETIVYSKVGDIIRVSDNQGKNLKWN